MVPTDDDDRAGEGRARARAAHRRRHGDGHALPRRRDQGPDGRLAAVQRVGRLDHRPRRRDRQRRGARGLRGHRAPPAADRRGIHRRGAGDRARRDGRGRQGGDRLDGRRHAARGAVDPLPAAQPLLPAELQPGDQPADRQLARAPGDDAEDPVRQPEERAGRGQQPDRDPAAREPVRLQRPLRAMVAQFGAAAVAIDCTFAPRPDALQAGLGAHPRRGGGGGARRRQPPDPDRTWRRGPTGCRCR